jgi:hypothetical protein
MPPAPPKSDEPEKPAEPGGGSGASPPPDDFHKFLVGLATDPAKLGTFIKDPDSSMKSAGLSDADQAVLKSGHPAAIHARLAGQTTAPPTVVTPQMIFLIVDMTTAAGGQASDHPTVRSLTSQGSQPMYPNIPPIYSNLPPQAPPQFYPPMLVLVTVAPTGQPQLLPPPVHPIYPPLQVVVHPQVVHPQIVHPQIVHPQIVHQQIVTPPQVVIGPPMQIYPPIYPPPMMYGQAAGAVPLQVTPPIVPPLQIVPPQMVFPQIFAQTPGAGAVPPQVVAPPQIVTPPMMMLLMMLLAQQHADALRAQYQPYLNLHPVFPVFPQIHPLIFPQITPPVFPLLYTQQ